MSIFILINDSLACNLYNFMKMGDLDDFKGFEILIPDLVRKFDSVAKVKVHCNISSFHPNLYKSK